MTNYVQVGNIQVADNLHDLVNHEMLTGSGVDKDQFWSDFADIIHDLTPRNKVLLKIRDQLQEKIDAYHTEHKNQPHDTAGYKKFLQDISYLLPEGEDFNITVENVDEEIALTPGPQLVVPVKNARFALNAANARWGSLYDALYGTDVISEDNGAERAGAYNPVRGAKVIKFARKHLDLVAPLSHGSHQSSSRYFIDGEVLKIELSDGSIAELVDKARFIAYQGDKASPKSILLKNNGLHVEIQIDAKHAIGKDDPAGVKDLLVEAAVTTIMDCEDSVAAVDAEDKVEVYSNWLGLMKGNLESTFNKGNKSLTRRMKLDRHYIAKNGSELTLHGRSLLFVRNVGHLMTNPAILDKDGNEVPEGIMDAMLTSLAALHDIRVPYRGVDEKDRKRNSRTGSINIVKPKMHGPDEVQFTCDLFARVEDALGLKRNTIKVGIMDEERRTTLNLKECIRVAKDRVVFINTGFLDRTGDEIHTSMLAGPFVPKTRMKEQKWISAYERWNVDVGMQCGLSGKAQIGKGMWAMPDEMAAMLEQKINHPESGANTAWVPSPNGATLHSIHYHMVDVLGLQGDIAQRKRASIDDILTLPLQSQPSELTQETIQYELDNNAQGILGYVVRWIDQGVGCSKVPNLKDVGLMEDRATLRISSQHIANWLEHDICTEEQVMDSFKRMAAKVDAQNVGDPAYIKMAPDFNSIAFQASCDLVFKGKEQPSGYTEPLLHAYRRTLKAV